MFNLFDKPINRYYKQRALERAKQHQTLDTKWGRITFYTEPKIKQKKIKTD